MQYRNRSLIASTIWVTLHALLWVGIIGTAWSLLKPGGWLYQFIAIVVDNRPDSYYCLAVGMVVLLAGKLWLNTLNPNAVANFIGFVCAFAGSYFILRLLLPL